MGRKLKQESSALSSSVRISIVAVPFPPHTIAPAKTRDDEVRNQNLVAIEMKRKKGGVTSEGDKKSGLKHNEAGIQTVVCKNLIEFEVNNLRVL